MLKGKTVVLGVTGSIAAYKIASLASMLIKQHADVHVIMTQNATNFIHPTAFETLTRHKCLVDTFDRNFQYSVEHVALAKQADVVLVAPASANVIGLIQLTAFLVISTCTLACSFFSALASDAILYAAILPDTASTTVLPFSIKIPLFLFCSIPRFGYTQFLFHYMGLFCKLQFLNVNSRLFKKFHAWSAEFVSSSDPHSSLSHQRYLPH